jgi:cilia- and flagella-associated protein 69
MEFIESCDVIHRKLSLTCLSQLVENPKTATYFDDWNSIKTMRNSTGLLVKLYEEEEKKYKVEYVDGVLQNLDTPLNPKQDTKEEPEPEETHISTRHNDEDSSDDNRFGATEMMSQTGGASSFGKSSQQMRFDNFKKGHKKLKEAFDSSKNNQEDSEVGAEAYLIRMLRKETSQFDLRGIIFAILYRTSFDKNDLAPEEKQRIEMIQIYPQVRIGEIWTEIKEDLVNKVTVTLELTI